MSLKDIALGVFLVVFGVVATFELSGDVLRVVYGIAAIVAGVLVFISDRRLNDR
jgi:uncharacterized membrane protein HdeD (DUF308 family)